MSLPGFRIVRMGVAFQAGEAAARLRHIGETPIGKGDAEDFGARQWADACGFDEPAVYGCFLSGFMDEVAKLGAPKPRR